MAPLPKPQATADAIYRAYEAGHDERERPYLGLSAIGEPCERKLWYGFRWAYEPEKFDGRMLRLFQTGHREEARLIADLERIGCTFEPAPDGDQHAVEAFGGHVRGHLDGIMTGLPEAPAARHVFEAKTHNAKSFRDVVSKGVEASKPRHHDQMQGYMALTGIQRAAYFAVEKDTDTIHLERVAYSPLAGAGVLAKADRIVRAQEPPARITDTPDSYLCRFCHMADACHGGRTWARRNCRTCLHATPVDGGWSCARHGRALSIEDQRSGCGNHLYIPALVPGRQIDADPERETVTYALADGGEWIDGQEDAA